MTTYNSDFKIKNGIQVNGDATVGGNASVTGTLSLYGTPTSNEHVVTKQYVDTNASGPLTTHAADDTVHLTSLQNAWIDGVTASNTEVNRLVGVTSNVQTQINAESTARSNADTTLQNNINQKVAKSGDTMTGNLVFTANQYITIPTPAGGFTADSQAVNKVYVDNKISGLVWEQPVELSNLIGPSTSVPGSPAVRDAYIVDTGGNTGDWSTFSPGDVVQFQEGNVWVKIKTLAVGDRFGVSFSSVTAGIGIFSGNDNKIATFTSATPGSITATFWTPVDGHAVFVENPLASSFGRSYIFNGGDSIWYVFSGPSATGAGVGLMYTGNTLNINLGAGIQQLPTDEVGVDVYASGGIQLVDPLTGNPSTSNSSQVGIKLDGTSLSVSSSGLKIADGTMTTLQSNISTAVTAEATLRTNADTTLQANINAEITARTNADITLQANINAETTARANADTTLQANINTEALARSSAVNTEITARANADMTLQSNVDSKVAKAGDTMTGHLVLGPSASIHKTTATASSWWMQQDGTGRQHWYWNTFGGTTPVFEVANEDAVDVMHTANSGNPYFIFRAASGVGKAAGDPIAWSNVLYATLGGVFQYNGNNVWHTGNLPSPEVTTNKGLANGYAALDSSGLVPTSQLPPAYGYTGSRGYTGSASTVIGYTGSYGYTGSTGYTGSEGSAGSRGYTGSASTVIGYTGSASTVIGYTGSTGVGYTGSQGVIGYTGSATGAFLPLAGGTLTGNLVVTSTATLTAGATTIGNGDVAVGPDVLFGAQGLIASESAMHLNINSIGGTNSFYVRTGSGTSSATAILTLTSAGNLTATGDITAFSDQRLKENFTKIKNAIGIIKQIDGGTFTWKTGIKETEIKAGNRDYGIIAQQVEAVMPEIVKETDSGYKLVAYEKLIPVLVEAIKELNTRVEALEK